MPSRDSDHRNYEPLSGAFIIPKAGTRFGAIWLTYFLCALVVAMVLYRTYGWSVDKFFAVWMGLESAFALLVTLVLAIYTIVRAIRRHLPSPRSASATEPDPDGHDR